MVKRFLLRSFSVLFFTVACSSLQAMDVALKLFWDAYGTEIIYALDHKYKITDKIIDKTGFYFNDSKLHNKINDRLFYDNEKSYERDPEQRETDEKVSRDHEICQQSSFALIEDDNVLAGILIQIGFINAAEGLEYDFKDMYEIIKNNSRVRHNFFREIKNLGNSGVVRISAQRKVWLLVCNMTNQGFNGLEVKQKDCLSMIDLRNIFLENNIECLPFLHQDLIKVRTSVKKKVQDVLVYAVVKIADGLYVLAKFMP